VRGSKGVHCAVHCTARPSPFNYYIEPAPDQLLRVSVAVGFRRTRLNYAYLILRGKDLETEQFSDERRVQQFEILKSAQQHVLDLQNWHEFLKAIRQAGFISEAMISSERKAKWLLLEMKVIMDASHPDQ